MISAELPEQMLRRLGISLPGEIDIEAIAWLLGVEVKYKPLESCEARLIGAGDRAIITVDDRYGSKRCRFSVAHELGHWQYHRGRSTLCRSDEIGSESPQKQSIEQIADRYAARILLPDYILLPLARQISPVTFENIDELAERFEASTTATVLRMVDLKTSPIFVICHNSKGRRWFRRGGDISDRWFPRDNLDAQSPAFDVQFGEQRQSRRTLVSAENWFDSYGADRYEVFEQSRKISSDDTLTILEVADAEMLE